MLHVVFFGHPLEKHPEIKELMGHDPQLKYAVLLLVIVQLVSAYCMRDASWLAILLVGYAWGGVINHSMTLAIHEIAHNLAFGHARPLANRALGIFGNLILAIPYSVVFKKYHLEHHKYQVPGCTILWIVVSGHCTRRLHVWWHDFSGFLVDYAVGKQCRK